MAPCPTAIISILDVCKQIPCYSDGISIGQPYTACCIIISQRIILKNHPEKQQHELILLFPHIYLYFSSEINMPLPLYLLTAVVWFVLSFALPHSEAVTTGALVARTESVSHPPDMPTLEPQSWCQEVIPNGKGNVIWHTKTGPCTYNTLRGDVTLKGTEWVQIQPTATVPNGPSQSDSRCIFSKVKTQLGNGNAYWKPADDESAQKDCNDYCARIATQIGDGDKIKSATCFKNDNKPWVNKQGKQPSGERLTRAKL